MKVEKWLRRSLSIALFVTSFHLVFPSPVNATNPVYSFTNAAATGSTGPTQAQINTAYTSTNLAGNVTISTQGIQEWVVPTSGLYGFEVAGGHGAASTAAVNLRGGRSALITARKTLSAGTRVFIVVGQAGRADGSHGGGGGASFVRLGTGTDTSTLIVAGGGGGTRQSASANGGDASITTSGNSPGTGFNQAGTTTFFANTSANNFFSGSTFRRGSVSNAFTDIGFGGLGAGSNFGDGGAGWLGEGYDDGGSSTNLAIRLSSTAVGGGATGTASGGFGGGGNGAGFNGGGGGGGYTGGNGGFVAGGGGSFVNGFDTQTIVIDTARSFLRNGTAVHGFVSITLLTAPSPTTVDLAFTGNVTSTFKGVPLTITATVGSAGVITFFANGKRISGCISRLVTTSISCTWRPPVHGPAFISAVLLPTNSAFSRSTSSNLPISVEKRRNSR